MISNRNMYLHDLTFFPPSAVLQQRLGSYDSGLAGFATACRYCRMYVHVSCTVYVFTARARAANA
jgi:hypothetical protein